MSSPLLPSLLALGLAGLPGVPGPPPLEREQRVAAGEQEPGAAPGERDEPRTRAAKWRRLREAKLEALEPYRPGFLERQILAFEKAERPSIFDINLAGIYPRIQGIAQGSQNAIGARLWRPNIAGSEIDLHASAFFSLAEYEFYDAQLGVIPGADARLEAPTGLPLRSTRGDDVFELATISRPDRHAWGVYASARYQHYTQLPFFGLGRDSRVEHETSYLQRDALYELHAAYQLGRALLLAASAGYMEAGIGPGEADKPSLEELFDESAAPGLDEQPRYRTAGALFQLDTRDVTSNPGRGAVLALQARRFDDPDARFSFTRLAVDARAFIPLGSPQRVLALRGYGVRDQADAGEQVPFFMQQTLGGSHTLRGFRNYRFRGERVALLQAEYRWEAVPAVELALFVDSGMAVSRQRQSIDLRSFRTSWGAAIRFKAPEAFLMRLEWARSTEGNRFFLRLSPAW
jgi:hypothetical protein